MERAHRGDTAAGSRHLFNIAATHARLIASGLLNSIPLSRCLYSPVGN